MTDSCVRLLGHLYSCVRLLDHLYSKYIALMDRGDWPTEGTDSWTEGIGWLTDRQRGLTDKGDWLTKGTDWRTDRGDGIDRQRRLIHGQKRLIDKGDRRTEGLTDRQRELIHGQKRPIDKGDRLTDSWTEGTDRVDGKRGLMDRLTDKRGLMDRLKLTERGDWLTNYQARKAFMNIYFAHDI